MKEGQSTNLAIRLVKHEHEARPQRPLHTHAEVRRLVDS
jgi:hypothetical protein